MDTFLVLLILSILFSLRTIVIIRECLILGFNSINNYIKYTRNKLYIKYVTMSSVCVLIIFQLNEISIF